MKNQEKYIQMYRRGTSAEELFQFILFDSNSRIGVDTISQWFEDALEFDETDISQIKRVGLDAIYAKYSDIRDENELDAEGIFRIAYEDTNERRAFTIGILMRVFDLNISDATRIAWSTLGKMKDEQ